MCSHTSTGRSFLNYLCVLTPLGRDRGSYILISGCLPYHHFYYFISLAMPRAGGDLVPELGMEPMPLQWICRVLTTGMPGNSLCLSSLASIYS